MRPIKSSTLSQTLSQLVTQSTASNMRTASDITSRASNEWQPAQQPFSQMPSKQAGKQAGWITTKVSNQGRPRPISWRHQQNSQHQANQIWKPTPNQQPSWSQNMPDVRPASKQADISSRASTQPNAQATMQQASQPLRTATANTVPKHADLQCSMSQFLSASQAWRPQTIFDTT